ncbi:MAG: T9SS type A sorting domain-containing protein [Chitinophagaceae bacterium]|nr:T9SS type A sorting domain-containing protein [Chitinophagaceae bacterium]
MQIRNQDNDAVANYSISYKVNTAAWKTLSGFTIAANTTALVVVDTFDFRDTITYTITLAIHNLDKPDPVSANDTIVKVLKHLPNNILSLSSTVFNDFESLPDLTLYSDTIGFSKDGFWDYATSNTDTGRMRTRIPGSKLVKSSRSISMDVNVNNKQTVNYVTATFNLSNYDTSIDEVRFDFDYEMRGMPVLRDSNKVWVRGSDLLNWIPVYTYSNVYDTVKMHNSGTLSLREIFAKNNHAFSTSTQIRFGQYDTTLIVDDNFGGGLTIDNVRLYKVLKDVQLTRVVAPTYSDCEIATTDVSLMVRNATVNTVKDIAIAYSLDGGAPIVEAISDSLLGNDSLLYIFKAPIISLSLGKHSIKAWIHTIGDDFPNNDTISDYIFYNSAYVNQFPILQNMEDNDGGWYVNGRNPSWAWGVPNGNNINTAASGSKVWKTNLNGNYNASELSYLVSPCYNTIVLANPMISFSTAFDLERCVAVCDRVYIEYSWDNEQTWTRLGTNGKGTNWYNNEMHNVWNGKETRWHVSSFELPRAEQLKLRFVMASDMGTNYDGFAIDDIHIYDRQAVIAKVNTNINTKSDPQNIDADKWSNVLFGNELLVAIRPSYLPLANIQVQAFAQNERQDTVKRQYIFPRSYLVSKPTMANESGLRLFITDAEANKVLDDTSCATCTKPVDIYRTGITQYVDDANNTEDNLLGNNSAKGSTFRPYNTVAWVPYDDGYYAEFNTKEFGEFWLNNGGILGTLPANTQYVALAAQRYNDDQALLIWQSPIDTQMKQYKLLRSTDNVNFELIDSVVAQQKLGASYQYYDVPKLQTGAEVYYKLQCAAQNDKEFYSNTASLSWTLGHQLLALYPVPSGNGQLRVKWTGPVNAKLSYFLTDMTGKNVFAGTVNAGQWQNESVIDLNFLAKGMYIIHLQIGANNYTEKVIFK